MLRTTRVKPSSNRKAKVTKLENAEASTEALRAVISYW